MPFPFTERYVKYATEITSLHSTRKNQYLRYWIVLTLYWYKQPWSVCMKWLGKPT